MQAEEISKVGSDSFQREVSESAVPVVVDFYADWCPPCKMVSPILEGLSKEYAGRARFVKVNVDDEPELSSKFSIMSIPTVMFFLDGKVKDAVVGAVPASEYRKKMESALKRKAEVA